MLFEFQKCEICFLCSFWVHAFPRTITFISRVDHVTIIIGGLFIEKKSHFSRAFRNENIEGFRNF